MRGATCGPSPKPPASSRRVSTRRSVERIRADAFDTGRRLNGAGTLRGILRPSFPDLETRNEVVAAAEALRDAGVSGIAFYNYGMLRRANLAWIADALSVFGA